MYSLLVFIVCIVSVGGLGEMMVSIISFGYDTACGPSNGLKIIMELLLGMSVIFTILGELVIELVVASRGHFREGGR